MSRSTRGMTLVEVMIALAVLAVGVTGALSSVIYASRSLGTGIHVDEGDAFAQNLLTTLMAVPATGRGKGPAAAPNTLFTNTSTSNDADVSDTAYAFTAPTLAAGSYDHADSELAGTPVGALLAPLPARYQRYWNIAPVPGSSNGVIIAVIVRWHEGAVWRRSVVVGTRYFP